MWSEFREYKVLENGVIWKNWEWIRGKWSGLEELWVNLVTWQKQATVPPAFNRDPALIGDPAFISILQVPVIVSQRN